MEESENKHGTEEARSKRLMAMGQMAASLAHEIRNPLGSMELYCSLLKKDLHEQPTLLELADQIHIGIKRLDRIISNCLQFSRDIQPRRKDCAPQAFLAELLTSLRLRAEEAQVNIDLQCHGNHNVSVDPYLLGQVVTNLVLNSVEAMSEHTNSEAASILVLSDSADAKVWKLSVSDNGPGIPLASQKQIFDPFYTTKSKGTGLGLSIVHSIIVAHGGTIEIDSRNGNGTTVIIEIPTQENQA